MLMEKIQLLDKLRSGQSFAACGPMASISQLSPTSRSKRDIRNTVALSAPSSAKVAANKIYNLHNLKITGESTLVDDVAAREYPAIFAEIIREKGYKPEQVFNADKTGLWRKKMPAKDIHFQGGKECTGLQGHMIKPMLLYRVKCPCALKKKDMHLLPVFYHHNKKAWMMAALFADWFQNCFVRQVKDYLQDKGLEFKVLLVIDNCLGHSEAPKVAQKNIKVIFLLKKTTTLLQTIDPGLIAVFKAKYMTRTFSRIQQALDKDTQDSAESKQEMWKKLSIADCISFIKQCHDDLTALC
ncbi:tigger transposable element-derived protein 1-like [Homarus americanus]|uniref:tigger transposable element-derived protein 1-like n=1 Tax=Homarus americanus TaxID=6706 RepID=UPI001C44E851|nr:tigger transposable element-derived protein 1-like [Homarus americanus]